jgi:hypothetical protein
VDAEERMVSAIGSFTRKFEPLDVGESADAAILDMDAVDRESGCGALKPFNVYMAH